MSRRRTHKIPHAAAAVALASLLGTTGCLVGSQSVGPVARAAIWAAAIVGTAIIVEMHDEHQHHEACGHYRRWHDDRWVYYYQERWEFYDEESGSWYVYHRG